MDYVWDALYDIGLTNNPSEASIPIFPERCQRDLYQHYQVDPEVIGQGSFAYIRRVKLLPKSGTERKDSSTSSTDSTIYDRFNACKTIPKSKVYDRQLFLREVYNLSRCQSSFENNHGIFPNNNHVIRLLDVIEDRSSVHIITELCEGGELYEYVTKEHNRTGRGLRGKALSPTSTYGDTIHDGDETRCAIIICQILKAFRFLHENVAVCHRDVKASNFVFVQTPSYVSGSLDLRVIDFGLSKFVGNWEKDMEHIDNVNSDENRIPVQYEDHRYMTSEVGTPYYVAPEVLTQQNEHHRMQSESTTHNIDNNSQEQQIVGYTINCDIWSIGVLAYLTLTGTFPVIGKDESETVEMLTDPNLEVDFSDEHLWEQGIQGINHGNQEQVDAQLQTVNKSKPKISNSAREFCRALLQRDPNRRPTAREALQFDWIVNHCPELSSIPPSSTTMTKDVPHHQMVSRIPSLSVSVKDHGKNS